MENTSTLLTDDLKKYGIMNQDDNFSEKLTAKEVNDFLNGGVLIAEDDKNRLTFKISDESLDINVFTKDLIHHKYLSTAELLEISSKSTNLYKVMADYGTITHIGTSYFNNNMENELTTFLEIENERGKTTFFGNKLQESLKDFKVGDKIQVVQSGIEKTLLKSKTEEVSQELAKFDNLFIIRPFTEKNKQFQSRLFELDVKEETVKDIDTTKYELQTVNGYSMTDKQLQQLRKGKEIKLDNETVIQLSPSAKNEAHLTSTAKALLITSIAIDGGLTFLIIKGVQKLSKMYEENEKQRESKKYLAELQKLKDHLQTKAEQYPDNKKIITDLNIVGKEISSVQMGLPEKIDEKKQTNDLANDRDMYEDANREKLRIDTEESTKSSTFSRGR